MPRALRLGPLLFFLLALAPAAFAQNAQIPTEPRQSTPLRAASASTVRPLPLPAAVGEDVERAAHELEAREQTERLLREHGVPGVAPARLPALDPDVVGGIQSRALRRVLGR